MFELSPSENGDWTERVLYNFAYDQVGNYDGAYPVAGLIFDAAGNLYGTTQGGGDYLCQGGGCGTVFELTPTEGGGWTEKKLHDFWEVGTNPNASLIFDAAGNLYSTTTGGGIHDSGTVFELSPGQGGGWTERCYIASTPTARTGLPPRAA